MPQFTYVSRNDRGERVTAIAEAETRQDLLGQLKERGLTAIEVQETSAGAAQAKARGKMRIPFSKLSFGRISTGELAVFWREFATMVEAGLPIVETLEVINAELEHVKLHRILRNVIARMWEGFNLSQALAKHPKVFSPMTVALIGAAEESGSLAEVADQLATYLENRDRLIRKVQAALTYPVFLVVFFLVAMAFATFWIVPQFRSIYEGFDAKLPWLTEAVFDVNAFLLAHLPIIAGVSIGVIIALGFWMRRKSGRIVVDRISLKMPIFGKILQLAAVSRFCRSLSILLAGGIPINRGLEMAEQSSGNSVVAKAIHDSRQEILKGSKIAAALKQHKIFPQMCVRMVAAGEETGNLSGMLNKVADFYESRVDAALTTINALIEPILIIAIGGFVCLFVLSIYMPIFMLAMTMK